jgi:hypothetical protein
MGFLMRWLFAFLLLAATYNPTPYSYVRMVFQGEGAGLSVAVLAGLILLVGYIIYLRATLRSIGAFGMALVLAIFAALIWVAVDFGLIDLTNPTINTWIALIAGATVLGIGLYWSHIRRALSGQSDMDDVDEP